MADRMNSAGTAASTATLLLRNVLGSVYNVEIKALSAYSIENLLLWPVDETVGSDDSWYTFADVPYGNASKDVPPAGLRNPTVDPRSCAAKDPSNKDLWRLPTADEMSSIITYVRKNGGYEQYGMANADDSGKETTVQGYLTASLFLNNTSQASYVRYNINPNTSNMNRVISYPVSKDMKGPVVSLSEKNGYIHVRCVQTK
jgi:hypothetical protein